MLLSEYIDSVKIVLTIDSHLVQSNSLIAKDIFRYDRNKKPGLFKKEGLGIDLERVTTLIPTHVHLDHAGGAGWLVEK
jgi:metal-dependent hydrolase (beta-lactamase superfamily II)